MRPMLGFKRRDQASNGKLPSAFTPSIPSQFATPYASSASSSRSKKQSIRITFEDWDKGGIFAWYRDQRHTTFRRLELRKERDRFEHEFIVIYLEDKSVYRVERRPLGGATTDAIGEKGCEAEDSITGPLEDDDLRLISSDTDAEAVLEFGASKPDLYTIIAVCVAIQMDPRSKQYTLQQYNCYFVARTITTIVARHFLLHQSPLPSDLRWDRVTESAISTHIFGANWDALDKAMKAALLSVLEEILWPVVKLDAETRIDDPKDWKKLKIIMKAVVHEVGTGLKYLVADKVKVAACDWILQASHATLWHPNLEANLLAEEFKQSYEDAVEGAIKEAVKSDLEVLLPDKMSTRLGDVLPKRLIHRIPPSVLADLPVELMARVPIKVLEKLPDDIFAKVPSTLLTKAPDALLQNLPPHVLSRASTSMILTLPDDMGRMPDRLLDISLRRMQDVLDRSSDPDRSLALKLLRRLPSDLLQRVDEKYRTMRNESADDSSEPAAESGVPASKGEVEFPPGDATVRSGMSIQRLRQSWARMSFLGFLLQTTPRPILERVPPTLVGLAPAAWLKTIPTEAFECLPPKYIAKLKGPCIDKLPTELFKKLPETLLQSLPRITLEQLPDSLLERLPVELIRNIPPELLEHLPEDLSDLLREAMAIDAFKGPMVRAELAKNVGGILKKTLIQSRGDLPETVLCASVRRSKATETLRTHQAFQNHIVTMIRKHSKKVAQVAHFGMGEEIVFSGLQSKAEEIWRVVLLHKRTPRAKSM